MKLGDIKIAALKLMFDTGDETVTMENLEDYYNDSNYGYRLNAMPESINRAMNRFYVNGLITKVTSVGAASDDNAELDCPEALAQIIPYMVKADLYEDDEPAKAAFARNIFETQLEEYIRIRPDLTHTGQIKDVFGWW